MAEGIKTRSQSRRVDDQPQTEMVDLVEDSQDEDYVPGMPILLTRSNNLDLMILQKTGWSRVRFAADG